MVFTSTSSASYMTWVLSHSASVYSASGSIAASLTPAQQCMALPEPPRPCLRIVRSNCLASEHLAALKVVRGHITYAAHLRTITLRVLSVAALVLVIAAGRQVSEVWCGGGHTWYARIASQWWQLICLWCVRACTVTDWASCWVICALVCMHAGAIHCSHNW